MCLLIFRRAFEDETTAFQVPVALPGDMLSKRLQPQHKASVDICINPSASPRQRWLLGRHPPLNLEKKKTSQEWWKNTANVVKLLHCYAAVRWLHWQVSDERFSGTSKNSHGFCYFLEFYNMTCKCAWDCLCMWVLLDGGGSAYEFVCPRVTSKCCRQGHWLHLAVDCLNFTGVTFNLASGWDER